MSAAGLQNHDLGNNESVVTGISHNPGACGVGDWCALTRTQSKWFKTEAGAVRWLARRGYNTDGTRAGAETPRNAAGCPFARSWSDRP